MTEEREIQCDGERWKVRLSSPMGSGASQQGFEPSVSYRLVIFQHSDTDKKYTARVSQDISLADFDDQGLCERLSEARRGTSATS